MQFDWCAVKVEVADLWDDSDRPVERPPLPTLVFLVPDLFLFSAHLADESLQAFAAPMGCGLMWVVLFLVAQDSDVGSAAGA